MLVSAMKALSVLGVSGCAERDKDFEEVPGRYHVEKPSRSMTTPSGAPVSAFSGKTSSSSSAFQRSRSRHLPADHWLQDYERLAHRPEDLDLLATYLQLAEVPESFGSPKTAKLLLTMLRFLHSLDIPLKDICCLLAHASVYFKRIYAVVGHNMNRDEVANVLVLLAFLAHCHIHDETCQLKVWHRYLFKGYCNLPMLSKATMELMKRLQYKLRVDDETLESSLKSFSKVVQWPVEEAFASGQGLLVAPFARSKFHAAGRVGLQLCPGVLLNKAEGDSGRRVMLG
ncbi:hypothetical protein AK812_SmicGene20006 [Symbiodinium microadriaticum]|uniref:Uncharacterized protein n=1 Tax=Symbiodinium microadriaticum TaxID=2951 RepID=A0A1Q9DR25_SYMMI|nr:hypothetical protein AK812_SmicGene20006 [Symbiodinium microadriaticum]